MRATIPILFCLAFSAIECFFYPAIGLAQSATVVKVVDSKGFLQGVLVSTPKVVFFVTVYGKLGRLAPRVQQATLAVQHYPKSIYDGNAGKVAEVDGIRISYYPCVANNPTLTGVHNYGNTARGISGSFPVIYNPDFQFACRNLSGNGGKVQRIGEIIFTYYPFTQFSYNGGKLWQVGNQTMTYLEPNSFSGKAGELQNP